MNLMRAQPARDIDAAMGPRLQYARTMTNRFSGWAQSWSAVLTIVFGLVGTPGVVSGQTPPVTSVLRPDFWDVDGPVHALVATNGVVYVGGSFSSVAPRGHKVAGFDAYTGESIPAFPDIVGTAVTVIIADNNGGWFLGGDFTSVGGLPRTNLVHVRTDFSVDSDFQPNPNGPVRALVLDETTLYVGGSFASIGNQSRSRLAALNTMAGTPTSWNPGANGAVSVLHLAGGVLYVGGGFSQAGGVARQYLAAFDPTSNTALSWAPRVDGDVLAIISIDNRIIVGGQFNVAGSGSAVRNGLAAFDRDTGEVIANWDPNPRDGTGPGGKVTSLQIDCNTVYVGGYFTSIGGAERVRVAALDAFSGLATEWDAHLGTFRAGTVPSSIRTLAVAGPTVFLGGEFSEAQGATRTDLVAVDAASSRILAWNPRVNGGIAALGVAGRTLLAAFVRGTGGVERHNLAAFDESTGRPLPWNPDANGTVLALAFANATLYAGGTFTEVGSQPRSRLAAIDATMGNVLTNWSAAVNSNVQALALNGGRVFAGGRFTSVNAAPRRRLAAFELATGQLVTDWTPSVEGREVQALVVKDDALFFGGFFSQVGSELRGHLAAVSTATGQLLPWDPQADDAVLALAELDGVIYVGGQFTRMGGQTDQNRAGAAGVLASSGLLTPWDPVAASGDLVVDVRAIAFDGSVIYLGGFFLEMNGQTRFGLGATLADNTPLGWNPGASPANRFNALAVSSLGVYAGGAQGQAFVAAADRRAFAAFPRVGAPTFIVPPADVIAGAGGTATFTASASGVAPLFYQWRFNGLILPSQTNATLSLINLTPANNGVYEITVSNVLGAIAAQASLLVLSPSQILAQPLSQSALPGATITLAVTASGSPPPNYQWRLNGVLIPGAVYPLLILTNVTAQSGGRYSVVVGNREGAQLSDNADVTIAAPAGAFADHFTNRLAMAGLAGTIRGSNVGASREDPLGEPRHAGKTGGASVWVKWVAPINGVVQMTTRGSGFDTLLGVYSNNGPANLSALREVAADEDRGGFLTSRLGFNAHAGVEYAVAVDGLGGASGDIVLSWETEAGATDLPVIVAPPLSQTVAPGNPATFAVSVAGAGPNRYQWYFGCQLLPGATNDTLVLPNVQIRHAGFYHVTILGSSGRFVESLPAALEVGPFVAGRSFEKLEDLLAARFGGGPAAPGGGGGGLAPAAGAPPLFLISLGLPISHTFSTSTNSVGLLINDCGVLSGGAGFLAFAPNQSGVMLVDTTGSDFDTVLSIYNYVDPLALAANLLRCDNDGALDGIRSRVTVPTMAGRDYLARVGGVGGARGRARINWRLEMPPTISVSNSLLVARPGSAISFDAGVTVAVDVPTTYQWFFNGVKIGGATNATLKLSTLNAAMTGAYSVVVSNFAGITTNPRAMLTVRIPLGFIEPRWTADRRFAFRITGEPNESFVIRAAPRLSVPSPWPVIFYGTVPANAAPVEFVDDESVPVSAKFYLVQPP